MSFGPDRARTKYINMSPLVEMTEPERPSKRRRLSSSVCPIHPSSLDCLSADFSFGRANRPRGSMNLFQIFPRLLQCRMTKTQALSKILSNVYLENRHRPQGRSEIPLRP